MPVQWTRLVIAFDWLLYSAYQPSISIPFTVLNGSTPALYLSWLDDCLPGECRRKKALPWFIQGGARYPTNDA
jgi:hypothetical protein